MNNTAFVYLRQKMVPEAKSLLLRKISSRGAEPIELANLALALGLSGEAERAERLFRAAEWWGTDSHTKAIIDYNRATLLVASGDYAEGKAKLKAALQFSRKSVVRYFRLSQYFAEASNHDPDFEGIISGK